MSSINQASVIEDHGTKVILSGLTAEHFSSFQEWDVVVAYLQDVVPLPFNPEFKFSKTIEKKFEEQDYRVVPLSLRMAEREEKLFRPYSNDIFSDDLYPPKFINLRLGTEGFGFAWVCINGRRVISDLRMRGLLLKKFGFSIGTRSYLERYFKRTVFHRRITGEIIVKNEGLIPNAARNDFENNATRQRFFSFLPSLIETISAWANEIQQDEKASETLDEVFKEVSRILGELPARARDKEILLSLNVESAYLEQKLKTHKKRLESSDLRNRTAEVQRLLSKAKSFIRSSLTESERTSRRIEDEVAEIVQAETTAKKMAPEAKKEKPTPSSIIGIIDNGGIKLAEDLRDLLLNFEAEFLIPHIGKEQYQMLLNRFSTDLEENE